jgi:hypothetical protein
MSLLFSAAGYADSELITGTLITDYFLGHPPRLAFHQSLLTDVHLSLVAARLIAKCPRVLINTRAAINEQKL